MAVVHVVVDVNDRQWTPPPKLKGIYYATFDTRELELNDGQIETVIKVLTQTVLKSIRLSEAEPEGELVVSPALSNGGVLY